MPSKRRVLSSDSEDSDDEDARYHKRIAANKEASRQGDRKEAARQKIRNQYFGPVAPAGSSLGGGFVRTNAGPEWKAPLKAGSCARCPAGKWNLYSGRAACLGCQAGRWSAQGAIFCSGCPKGKYGPKKSATLAQCLSCPAGRWNAKENVRAACNACPNGISQPVVKADETKSFTTTEWSNAANRAEDGRVHGPFHSRQTVSKTWSHLKKHSAVSLSVRFWAIDSWDSNERGYIYLDGKQGWSKGRGGATDCRG